MSIVGSLEIRASKYISVKLKTYTYKLLPFPVEINNRQKNSDNFYFFSHKVWFIGPPFRLIKPNFHTITWGISWYEFRTILTCCRIWKLILLNISITYLASYVWVFIFSRFARKLTQYGVRLERWRAGVWILWNYGSTKQFKPAYKEV